MPVLEGAFTAGTRSLRAESRLVRVALALALSAMIGAHAARAETRRTREYDLKAAFLFNFTQFVEWPSRAFPDASAPMTICLLGEDPFGQSLDEIVGSEIVRDRRLVVRRFAEPTGTGACQILFLGPPYATQKDRLRPHLDGKAVLKVSDGDGSPRPAMIQFVIVDKKVRLRIDASAAKQAGLTVSSKLLRQAEIFAAESKE